jgi:hypothetical protein
MKKREALSQVADGAHYGGDGLVVVGDAVLQLVELFRELGVRCGHRPQPYEGAHDGDIHGNRAAAVQHGGQHRDALLRERVGKCAAPAPLFEAVRF